MALTSASSNGYTVTASSSNFSPGYENWKLYNRVTGGEGWHTSQSWTVNNGTQYNGAASLGSHVGEWNKIQFTSSFILQYVIITGRTSWSIQAPNEWSIIGSNDNSTWTLLLLSKEEVVTSSVDPKSLTVQVNAAKAYTYFALVVHKTKGGDGWCTVSELEYYGYTL